MLTSIPASVLHRLRAVAAALLLLAELGLELCCDCGDNHDGPLHELEHGPAPSGSGLILHTSAAAHPSAFHIGVDRYDLATDLAEQGLRACCGQPSAVHCL